MGDKIELNRQISAFYDDYHRGRPRQPDVWMQKHYWTSFVGETLEVGGGTLYPDRRDYAVVDLSTEAVRRALAQSIPALVADGSRLPFRSGAFDTVACHDVLEHVTDPEGFIAEMCRVARGRLVIAGPNYIAGEPGHLDRRLPGRILRFLSQPQSRLQDLKNPHLTFDDQWQPDRDAVCAANAAWVADAVRRHGFRSVKIRTWEVNYHFLNAVPVVRCLGPFMFVVADR